MIVLTCFKHLPVSSVAVKLPSQFIWSVQDSSQLSAVYRNPFRHSQECNRIVVWLTRVCLPILICMQITDNVLEALLSISQLKAIRIGYSCKFTMQGVLGLTQMTNLEQLHVMGHSTQDFGHFSADDISKLQSLKKLTSLSIGVVPAEAFKVKPFVTSETPVCICASKDILLIKPMAMATDVSFATIVVAAYKR